jgi:hypothetical protein
MPPSSGAARPTALSPHVVSRPPCQRRHERHRPATPCGLTEVEELIRLDGQIEATEIAQFDLPPSDTDAVLAPHGPRRPDPFDSPHTGVEKSSALLTPDLFTAFLVTGHHV